MSIGSLVCVVHWFVFIVYVHLQHHKVGKMQLVVQKIVVVILLSSVVESPLRVQAQPPPREYDFVACNLCFGDFTFTKHFCLVSLEIVMTIWGHFIYSRVSSVNE